MFVCLFVSNLFLVYILEDTPSEEGDFLQMNRPELKSQMVIEIWIYLTTQIWTCDAQMLAFQVEIVPPLEPAYYPGRQVRRLWQGGQVAFFLFRIFPMICSQIDCSQNIPDDCNIVSSKYFRWLQYFVSGQQPLPLHPLGSTSVSTWVYCLKRYLPG